MKKIPLNDNFLTGGRRWFVLEADRVLANGKISLPLVRSLSVALFAASEKADVRGNQDNFGKNESIG
jgi:hypothetical protein